MEMNWGDTAVVFIDPQNEVLSDKGDGRRLSSYEIAIGVLEMHITNTASTSTAPTQMLQAGKQSYAYRRFGSGSGCPLVCLQHFTGALDNWDPAVTDPLASEREVI